MPNNTVILYWKYGCKGCELAHHYLENIKLILANLDTKKRLQYQVSNPQLTTTLHFRKHNILNEETNPNPHNHDTTPKLKLYRNGEIKDLHFETSLEVANK
jgi:hypothetical protein